MEVSSANNGGMMEWKLRFWKKPENRPAVNEADNRQVKSRPVGKDGTEWQPSDLPRNGTVGGFVEWLAAQLAISDADDREWARKLPRVWRQKDLYDFYQEVCREWQAKTPVGIRRFVRELDQSGCKRAQGDWLNPKGVRERPMLVEIPDLADVKVPVSLRVKVEPPFPKLKKGPGIANGNAYAAIKKNGGSFSALVKAA
jgi:hypothetical protein